MTPRSLRHRQSGLTLLEIIAASAMLAAFLMAVYSIVFSTLQARQDIESNTLPYGIGPLVMQRVAEDLRMAWVEPFEDFDAFVAKAESSGGVELTQVDFVSAVRSRTRVTIDDDDVSYAINEVGYRVRDSEIYDDAYSLWRREDNGVDDKPLEGGRYYKLVDGVLEFRIDFYEEDPGDPEDDDAVEGELEWNAKDQEGLPWGCRVTLVIQAPVEVDDRGDPVEEPQIFRFVDYIAFPTRFDPEEDGGGQ